MQMRSSGMANPEAGEGIWVSGLPSSSPRARVRCSGTFVPQRHAWRASSVPESGPTRPVPPAPRPFAERAPSRPRSAPRRPGECAELGHRKPSKTRAPASLGAGGWRRASAGTPHSPLVPRPFRPPPRALWLPADCRSVPRGSGSGQPAGPGNSSTVHGTEKSTHHLIRRGSWSAGSRGAAGRSSPAQPRPGSWSHPVGPPAPPPPGRQRARAQSPPGRRRSGEAAACAVDRAGGARCGHGPRDAPVSHLLLLLPPLPARFPVARDHLRYVLG